MQPCETVRGMGIVCSHHWKQSYLLVSAIMHLWCKACRVAYHHTSWKTGLGILGLIF